MTLLDPDWWRIAVTVASPMDSMDLALMSIGWEEPQEHTAHPVALLRLQCAHSVTGDLAGALVEGYLTSRGSSVRRLLNRYPGGVVGPG